MSGEGRGPFDLLGLTVGSVSPDQVRAAFRQKAFDAHPDRGGSAELLDLFVKARDAALAYLYSERCPACRGVGAEVHVVGFASASFQCAVCGGTGLKWPEKKVTPG